MPVQPQSVPFTEAIENLRSKLRISTQYWDDLRSDMHAKAFTVAGATKADLLKDLHDAVTDAIANGETIETFRAKFDEAVTKHGWTYKGSRGWRTRVIYDTNMRTARAAGRWEQIQRDKERRPYLMYGHTPGQENPREIHVSWNGTLLPVDDPWWNTHYPPNGFGCKCFTRTMSARQAEREGRVIGSAPKIKRTRRINTTTGEDYGEVPEGIQPGFDYNVGKSSVGADREFGRKLASLPPAVRPSALSRSSIKAWSDVQRSPVARFVAQADGAKTGSKIAAGLIDEQTLAALAARESAPASALITLAADTAVAFSGFSERLKALPTDLAAADEVLWDTRSGEMVVVLDRIDGEATIARLRPVQGDATGTGIRSIETVSAGEIEARDRFEVLRKDG